MTYAKALQEAKDTCKECLTVNDCVKEECRWHWIIKALERQIPQKPKITIHNGFCPNCKNAFGKKYVEEAAMYPRWKGYCPVCGQAIDWSDNNG